MVKRSSMGRGMEVLQTLAAASGASESAWRVSGLAQSMERERSQVARTLAQSASSGLVEGRRRGYRISANAYAIAQALTESRLRADGLAVLERLSRRVGEACFLGELYGDSTVTIAEFTGKDPGAFASWIGRAYPAFTSDAGQAALWDADDDEVRAVLQDSPFGTGGPRAATSVEEFLDRLHQARARGYSIVDEEAEAGLFSVAAPVFDFRGETVAAVQIVGERDRMAARVVQLGQACQEAADELTSLIGGVRPESGEASEFARD
ncbi:MAG: IclR family transcriptional regulator C-terminal domain-containing protein [Propioniciclava sp.]|uniref:IclR family transcriptional regulator n=1 Tax=Propioniciclava sp. TaxID=2038686 RepID=UPI0039E30656